MSGRSRLFGAECSTVIEPSSVFLLKRLLNRFGGLHPVSQTPAPRSRENTYINKLLQILIQIRQIILPLLIVRNEHLLLLQQPLPRLFQRLSLRVLVTDSCSHQAGFIVFGVLGVLLQEFLDGD